MSIFDKCSHVDLTDFPGAQQNADEEDAVQTGALLAENVEFGEGSVSTRNGFGIAITPNINSTPTTAIIPNFDNWLIANGNILIFMVKTGSVISVRARFMTTPDTEYELLADTAPAVGMVGKPTGKRWYMAFYSTGGLGAIQGQVWDGNNTNGVPNVTPLFQRPMLTSELTLSFASVAVTPGEIALTAGTHNAAFVITTKNGYKTGLSPAVAGGAGYIVVPLTFTADGVSAYTITGTPVGSWPNWCSFARVVMTPTSNLNKYYYVPFSTQAQIPTPGSSTPITLRIAVDDTTLISSGVSQAVEDLQNLYHADTSYPHCIAPGTSRMAYLIQEYDLYLLSQSTVYVSEPEDPQYITADQHSFIVPGGRMCFAIAWQGSQLFIFGPNWTYSRADNNLPPVEWPPIEVVDERIGTRFNKGALSNPTRGYIWVAHESGLYQLIGSGYPIQPISWLQGAADWKRINFAAPANTLEIEEFAAERLVIVKAPLDGASVATHLLVWNYTHGAEANQVRYAIFNIKDIDIGGIDIVIQNASQKQELWVSRGDAAGPIYRRKHYPVDTADTVYDDNGVGIESDYIGPPVIHDGAVYDWVGAHLRVRGGGNATFAARSLDGANSDVAATPVPLSLTPGKNYVRLFRVQSESLSMRITNAGIAGSYFILSRIRHWFKPWIRGRS